MPSGHGKRTKGWDLLLASLLVTAGLVICGVSLVEISRANVHLAQATQPLQPSTPDASGANKPAESKPGGERPTTPAPEPARPGEQAQKEGAQPALPPAPAEKIAPPMQQK
jgi:hypothetical protein